jgi:hypothetical protein
MRTKAIGDFGVQGSGQRSLHPNEALSREKMVLSHKTPCSTLTVRLAYGVLPLEAYKYWAGAASASEPRRGLMAARIAKGG